MSALPVIAIFDIGKTNKKIFLFDEDYRIVYEHSARLPEIADEDGFPCEDLDSLRHFVMDSLRQLSERKDFSIKAANFSAYGASMVYLDNRGLPVTPLYNYLKPYPRQLQEKFYAEYGGEQTVCLETASPVLGSLNSGLQLYRIRNEKPEQFRKIVHALHLPQYISYLVTGRAFSEITSVGCHTHLWNFVRDDYHSWVYREGIFEKLPSLVACSSTVPAMTGGFAAGPGIHDSSAALIPYHASFGGPFALISSGTWCISLNPFNQTSLTIRELKKDSLCFMSHEGSAVKASRIFAGNEHEEQVSRIAVHFHKDPTRYQFLRFNPEVISRIRERALLNGVLKSDSVIRRSRFGARDLNSFGNDEEAYHQLIQDLVHQQFVSTSLVLRGADAEKIFVDGGFGKNDIYMNLLAASFSGKQVYAASVSQASALGAALAIHQSWNAKPVPDHLIQLRHYSSPQLVR